jgi:hypothetical protein
MTAAGFYHCSAKPIGRSDGRSIVAAAAYRSGERLEDERTGQVADYRARSGVEDSFILTRSDAPAWGQERERLWNEAGRAEPRKNGRLATELELGLPHELDAAARQQLLKDFLAPIIERYGVAADVAIHAPGQEGDHRNYHAHVLVTHRELGPEGFGDIANTRTITRTRKGREVQEQVAGIAATPADVKALRQEWERHVNRAYERAGLDVRVDHRSHQDRGIQQEPTKHLGATATAMERRGEPSERGAINRDIETRNAAAQELARLKVEAVKLMADYAAEKQLAEMERQGAATKEARPDPTTAEQEKYGAGLEGQGIDNTPASGHENGRQEAPQTRTDDPEIIARLRPLEAEQQPDYAAAKGRTDDVRPDAEQARKADPVFGANAERMTGPGIFDRDAADAAWQRAVEDEAIKAAERAEQEARAAARGRRDDIRPVDPSRAFPEAAQEATERREAAAASTVPQEANTREGEPQNEREPPSAREAPHVIYLGPPPPAIDRTEDQAVDAAVGMAASVADAATSFLSGIGEALFPSAPPTPEEQKAKRAAAEEQERLRPAAEQEAERQELLRQLLRNKQIEELQLSAILGGNPTAEMQQGRDQYERQREQERERELRREP